MFDTKDNRAWAIIVVFGIVIGYFSLSWAGAIPEDYNIVEHYFNDSALDEGTDNTTSVQGVEYSECVVTGIPNVVDLNVSETNTYTITFTATEDVVDDISIFINDRNSMCNATIELSQGADPYESWVFYQGDMRADYVGAPITPYESVTVTLTISGDEFIRAGTVAVYCSSNGIITQNAGIISILHG